MELSEESHNLIGRYLLTLTNYNQKVNLVGNCEPHMLIERHTLDGLTLVSRIRKELAANKGQSGRQRYLDLGTGGGLPGMIVALACPELAVTLLDATAKKCAFLEMVARELGQNERIEVVNGRAEELARESQFRERYRFVTARAVGTLKVTSELAIPFLKPGGLFLAQKTTSRIQAEIAESKDLLSSIGAEIGQIEALEQYEELKEALIVPVKKLHATPQKYPREWKQIVPAR
ncbi:MAG: 16S rRNA (guanine(527)-N(7))-methyltransferase RsmG [Cyanobacteria bacterium SZAS LIN-2]|nr:16S rRNA (guanine(527)-N(7))-methyltransferase RsmG [Cyanobacteria bacterium SZAS LIN-3]MBS1995299.1 16S rRNA (guanine(527)-N(7))-methyltransferase RsmG [Cyanobacteria bacterium SZAS LIN-2]